ncbi:TonB-dependent receptor plug domain-containing protein [Ruixingdingia sedimenti]|uniref:TonB-dependent receptor n=1 Tax=Ruixingdingia sedimenti TaxID=3073604 RepID=A0ABU1FCF6_9RHOB|nr:TonB-dependent receptor [Xinfangfangia sp. LG-4]MDR5654539.1 TonB-dependent receptor [Xinfangfangia sp. LG-4]
MTRFASLTALATIFVAGAAPLRAEPETTVLDEIVLTANRIPTAADRTGASVSVIDDEALAEAGSARLATVLDRLPGFSLRSRGPAGTQMGFTLRGATQNYVGVYVDGIDVTDPSGTQVAFDFGGTMATGLSRVEVLRGSQSALYGSRAIGGVISITTARATEEGTHQSLAVEAGSFGTASAIWGLTHKSDRGEAALTLGRFVSDGFSAADEAAGNTEADGFRQSRVSFNGALNLEGGARIGLSAFLDRSTGAYDEGFPLGDGLPPYDEINKTRSGGLRVFAEFDTGPVAHELSASTYRIERRIMDGNAWGTSDTTYTGTRRTLAWQGVTDLGQAATLAFGADWNREDYDAAGTYGAPSARTTTTGVFAEIDWAVAPTLDIATTLRHDDHSLFGGATTGRIALAWRPTDRLTIRAQAGTGYRAPSNYELYSAYGSVANQPETSRTLDFGVEYRPDDRTTLRATAFLLEVEDLIDYDFASTACPAAVASGWPGCYVQVPGTSRRSGVELEGAFDLSNRLRLTASYAYIDSKTNASSAWARVPQHELGLGLDAVLTDRLTAGVSLQHAAGRRGMKDYTLVDARLGYAISDRAEAYLRVENLFDEQYQLVNGYGTSDRAVYVGLSARF